MRKIILIASFVFLFNTSAYAHGENLGCDDLSAFYSTAVEYTKNYADGKPQEILCLKLGISNKKLDKGEIAKAILLLNKYITVAESEVGKSINATEAETMVNEAKRLIVILEGNMNLPPDPGEAGKATLAGIDSDGDGVRDDLQRYLALSITDSERFLHFNRMEVKHMQKIFDVYEDKEASRELSEHPARTRCFFYITQTYDIDIDVWTGFKLTPQVVNTRERLLAYHQYERHNTPSRGPHAGEIDMAFYKSECDFDPDALAN